MLRTIYLYELKKLFRARVNLIALTGAVIMLLLLVVFSISEVQPVSRDAAKELDGRTIDGELIEEMKPAMRFENGSTLIEITAEYEKYVPVMEVITSVTGYDRDLTRFDGSEFYALREQELKQRIEKQGLPETEKEFWRSQEAQVSKPFVYHSHSGPANLLKCKPRRYIRWYCPWDRSTAPAYVPYNHSDGYRVPVHPCPISRALCLRYSYCKTLYLLYS